MKLKIRNENQEEDFIEFWLEYDEYKNIILYSKSSKKDFKIREFRIFEDNLSWYKFIDGNLKNEQ